MLKDWGGKGVIHGRCLYDGYIIYGVIVAGNIVCQCAVCSEFVSENVCTEYAY